MAKNGRREARSNAGSGFAIRRRLLKAVAGAAPVVMTLPVGTQAAAASLACTAKPVDPAQRPADVLTAPQTDRWVRKTVEVWRFHLKRGGDSPFDVLAWQINGLFYATENQPNGYAVGTPVPIFGDQPHPPNSAQPTERVRTDNLLYYVTPEGSLAQVYPLNAGTGNPLSTSCWTSIPPGTLTLG